MKNLNQITTTEIATITNVNIETIRAILKESQNCSYVTDKKTALKKVFKQFNIENDFLFNWVGAQLFNNWTVRHYNGNGYTLEMRG